MKRKNLKKLEISKIQVSALQQDSITGGYPGGPLEETIRYTACYGDRYCRAYQTNEDCWADS